MTKEQREQLNPQGKPRSALVVSPKMVGQHKMMLTKRTRHSAVSELYQSSADLDVID